MIRVFPLDFLAGPGAMFTPKDKELHDMTVDFCRQEIKDDVNLSDFAKVWVAAEEDKNHQPVKVLGVFAYVLVPDVPLCRATDPNALRALANRYNDFLADNGARGKQTFVHIARGERPEQKCPGWADTLKDWGAKLADRVAVKVR